MDPDSTTGRKVRRKLDIVLCDVLEGLVMSYIYLWVNVIQFALLSLCFDFGPVSGIVPPDGFIAKFPRSVDPGVFLHAVSCRMIT